MSVFGQTVVLDVLHAYVFIQIYIFSPEFSGHSVSLDRVGRGCFNNYTNVNKSTSGMSGCVCNQVYIHKTVHKYPANAELRKMCLLRIYVCVILFFLLASFISINKIFSFAKKNIVSSFSFLI